MVKEDMSKMGISLKDMPMIVRDGDVAEDNRLSLVCWNKIELLW